jgi:hypothetical protein
MTASKTAIPGGTEQFIPQQIIPIHMDKTAAPVTEDGRLPVELSAMLLSVLPAFRAGWGF